MHESTVSSQSAPRDVVVRYAVLAILEIAAKATTFGATVAIARYFREEGFGRVTLAQSITAYGLVVGTLGRDLYAVRNVAAWPATLGRVASTVMMLRSLLGVPAFVLLVLCAALIPQLNPVFGLVGLFGVGVHRGSFSYVGPTSHAPHTGFRFRESRDPGAVFHVGPRSAGSARRTRR